MTDSISYNEPGLPSRKDRHKKKTDRKKDAPLKSMPSREQKKSKKIKKRSVPKKPLDQQKRTTKPNEETKKSTKQKREKKGSLIFANLILWGFLLLVGGILFYTIRHY